MITILGEAERDRTWKSTLTGACFMWVDVQWLTKTKISDWHPAGPVSNEVLTTVFGRPNEKFVEVDR